MDPLICLKNLITSYMDGNETHTAEYAQDFIDWIKSGGFTPHRARITMMLEAIVKNEAGDEQLLRDLKEAGFNS